MESETLNNSVDLGASVPLPIGSVGVGEGDEVPHRFGARPAEQPECNVSNHFLSERDLHGYFRRYRPVSPLDGNLSAVLPKIVLLIVLTSINNINNFSKNQKINISCNCNKFNYMLTC